MNHKPISQLERWIFLAPIILFIVVYYDLLITNQVTFTHDTIHWYGVFNYFILSLSQGHLPLWDPYSLLGQPFYFSYNVLGALDPIILLMVPLAKWAHISALDLYEWRFVIQYFVFYLGTFCVGFELTKNRWAATFAAGITLFFIAPSGLAQHGVLSGPTYIPLATFALLRCLAPTASKMQVRIGFLAFCYLTGIAANDYLPSYYLVFFQLFIFFACFSGQLPLKKISQIWNQLGIKYFCLGTVIYLVLAGPFIYAVVRTLSSSSEVFSYYRIGMPADGDYLVHTSRHSLNPNISPLNGSLHNLFGGLFPGADVRFYMNTLHHDFFFGEYVFYFGALPLLLLSCFLWRVSSRSKYLFLGMSLILLGYLFLPGSSLALKLLRLIPSASSINQLLCFFSYFVFCWGTLLCLATHQAMVELKNMTRERAKYLTCAFAICAVGYMSLLAFYFYYLQNSVIQQSASFEILAWTESIFSQRGWHYLVIFSLFPILFWLRSKFLRQTLLVILMLFTFYSFIRFNWDYAPYVLHPHDGFAQGPVHYDRPFTYSALRAPYVPTFGDLQGYIEPLLRVPSATPSRSNPYAMLSKRSFDYMRMVPLNKQRLLSGIGQRRFGFYDEYVLAESSTQALDWLTRLTAQQLSQTLVLEHSPKNQKVSAKDISDLSVGSEPLALNKSIPASKEPIANLFDQSIFIPIADGQLSSPQPLLRWTPDLLGFFDIFPGAIEDAATFHRVFRYFPKPSVVYMAANKLCFKNYHEWYLHQSRPQFYPLIYKQSPFECDLDQENTSETTVNTLTASPFILGPYVSNDIGKLPLNNSEIRGFTVLQFDPRNLRSDVSPYARNEPTRVSEFSPNHISFEIENSRHGLFYLAESYSRDWQAEVDGQKTDIYISQFNFMSIEVPSGIHQVTFRFNPPGLRGLLWSFILVSLIGLALPLNLLSQIFVRQDLGTSEST